MIVNILLCVLWLIIIPTLLGLLYNCFVKNEKDNIILIFISGYFIQFALFEILAIPFTFLKLPFTTLLYAWSSIIIIFTLISIIINRKKIINIFVQNIKNVKKLPITTSIFVVLLILQLFVLFKYFHVDDDDAVFVGNATTTIATNTINMYNPSRGNEWGGWQTRTVLSPFPIYLATMSEIIDIHPAILAHTVFPLIFVVIVYMIFTLIAEKLFNKNKKQVMLFLIFLSILYIFGNYSRRTTFSVLFLRIWQGKAFLANAIIPAIWYFILKTMDKESNIADFIMLILVMISACLVSSMGVPLAPITLMSMILVYAIKEKKISYLFKYLIACIPCLLCGIIYLILS